MSPETKGVIRSLTEELVIRGTPEAELASIRKQWSDELKVTPDVIRGTSAYIRYEAGRATRLVEPAACQSTLLPALSRSVREASSHAEREQILSASSAQAGIPLEVLSRAVSYYNQKLLTKEGGVPAVADVLGSPLAVAAGLAPKPAVVVQPRGHLVDYSKCPLKAQHRDCEVDFVRRHSHKDDLNSGITVFLPSQQPHLQGEKILSLGIRPGLVYGVENEAEAWPACKRGCAALGINSRFDDVQQFLRRVAAARVPVRYVSLDFDSQFSGVVKGSLEGLREAGAFFLTLNVQGRREPAYWRDLMKVLCMKAEPFDAKNPDAYPGVPHLTSRRVAAELESGGTRKEIDDQWMRERVDRFDTSGHALQAAREGGLIHGIPALLPKEFHKDVDARHRHRPVDELGDIVIVSTNRAYDRLIAGLLKVPGFATTLEHPVYQRMLYEMIKYSLTSTRFPTACEAYHYQSTTGKGSTPMFSVFFRIAPLYFLDKASPEVAQFFRTLSFASEEGQDVRVVCDTHPRLWGSVFQRSRPYSVLRVMEGHTRLAITTTKELNRAISAYMKERRTWLHDDHLAAVEPVELTAPEHPSQLPREGDSSR